MKYYLLKDSKEKNNYYQIRKKDFYKEIISKVLTNPLGLPKAVKKVKSVFSLMVDQNSFDLVMHRWAITIVKKQGLRLKQGMAEILQKVKQVPLTGLTKFYGQVQGVVRKILPPIKKLKRGWPSKYLL